MQEFLWPENLDQIEKVANARELRIKLNQIKTSIGNKVSFKLYQHKQHYIYAYCLKFTARMRYKYDSDINVEHRHSNFKKHQFETITRFMTDLPSSLPQNTMKHVVLNNFRIAESQFYYIYRRHFNPILSYSELMRYLQEQDCYIQSQPWSQTMNQKPDILIVASPAMKNQFERFGQWVYFDTTYNIIKHLHQNNKKFKVGLFIGLNAGRKIVPFGWCIIAEQTKDVFYKVFRAFFEMMGKAPGVILTDEGAAIKGAIDELRQNRQFEGVHLFDNYHIIKNVKKKLRKRENIQYFLPLLQARTHEQFQKQKQLSLQSIVEEEDMQTLIRFLRNGQQYCYSQVPPVLFGLSVTDAPCQKANDIVKSRIPIEKPYTNAVKTIYDTLETLIKNAEQRFQIDKKLAEEYYCFSELKYLRVILCKLNFRELLKQVKQVYSHEMKQIYQEMWCVTDINHLQYKVTLDEDTQLMRCSCQLIERSGLPCSHLIKCIKMQGKYIEPYIHQRWKRNQWQGSNLKKKMGRGRNTRTRR